VTRSTFEEPPMTSCSPRRPAHLTCRSGARAASVALAALLLVATGCSSSSSSTPAANLTGLSITPATVSLQVGGAQQLTATGTYSDGSTQNVTASASWVSSVGTTATVTNSGLVSAVATGTTRITATYGGKTATRDVTVSPATVTLTSIAIGPNPAAVDVGFTLQLAVTGTFSDSSTLDLTGEASFISSTTSVATVSAGGLVTGVAAGTSTVTATARGKTATRDVTVSAVTTPGAAQIVFWDGYGTDVSFRDFGGAANNVNVDTVELFHGRKSIKFDVTGSGSYSGGAWVAASARDLSAYDALTFWAKASVAGKVLNVTGFGNDAGAAVGLSYATERANVPLGTAWQKYTIPVPDPAVLTSIGGLFHVAEGPEGYTIYLADVIYEHLGAGVLGTGSAAIAGGASALPLSVNVGATTVVPAADSRVSYAIAADPSSVVTLTPVSDRFFAFTSSNSGVASVAADGTVSGVAAGGPASLTATLRGAAAAGSYAVTVLGVTPAPATLPPLPAPPAGSAVISLYASRAGGFTGSTVTDKSGNVDTWLTCWSAGTGGDPAAVTVGGDTANPRKYDFTTAGGKVYAGVEFLGKTGASQPGSCNGTITGANTIDVSGMTHFHIDVWTPDATNVQVKLVDAGPGGTLATQTDANATLNGLATPTFATGTWLSYDIPLSIGGAAFQNGNWVSPPSGLTHLGQMVFTVPNGGTIYVDNIYFYNAGGAPPPASAPAAAPAAPTRLPANVMSLYSPTYAAGIGAGDFSGRVDSYHASCFGPPGASVADHAIPGGETVKKYTLPANTFGIIELIGASGGTATAPDSALCGGGTQVGTTELDVSGMTALHLDVWTPDGSANFQVQLVDADGNGFVAGPGAPLGAGTGSTYSTGANVLAAGSWISLDIPFSTLGPPPGAGALQRLALVKLFTTTAGTFYVDNLYFYKPPTFANLTYEDPAKTYTFGDFGGAYGVLALDPVGATTVAKIVKTAGAQSWAGVTLSAGAVIPFSSSRKIITLRVYAPAAGIPFMLKVENSANGGIFVEKQAPTTGANTWETLTFDYGAAPGIDLAQVYDKISVFPDFNTVGGAADVTYYVDDLILLP
jgi:hypothetical protein